MNIDQAKLLRKEFDIKEIGLKPQVNCKACTNAARQAGVAPRDKHCDRHQVQTCNVCNNWITTGHVHLDFVGHAAATDRLLQVDPEWTWEPMGKTPAGTPSLDTDGNLWIWLTVAGVTRPGCGDGPNMKEKIGDAIRNAAMRFGVALDLWTKQDLQGGREEEPTQPEPAAAAQHQPADDHKSQLTAVKRRVMTAAGRVYPQLKGDNLKDTVTDLFSDRGLDKDSVADVMKLAAELEGAK